MVYGVLILVCCAVCLLMRMPRLQRFRHMGLMSMLAMMAVVSALRSSDVGTDGPMYARLLRHPGSCRRYGFETGYCLVNNAMHWLESYTVLLVLENMLLYCAIGLFIYRYIEERWWGFSCLMVFGTRMFFMAMNVSRQYIAVALCMFAFMLYVKTEDARAGRGAACRDLPHHFHRDAADSLGGMVDSACQTFRTAVHDADRGGVHDAVP